MSDQIDISLDQFLSEVKRHNLNPDGSVKDKSLLQRMQHSICLKCHENYKVKYPGQPFLVSCKGIYGDSYFTALEKAYQKANPEEDITQETKDEIRESLDVVFWASRNIVVKDDQGNLVPFEARWYQEETLRCTARHKVDRWGRGLGKTLCGVIEELHKAVIRKGLDILIVCPADAQSEKWYTEIDFQIQHSPSLHGMLKQQKQQPFKFFKLNNDSTISIFTAGSASGRGANSLRGQDPWRVRLDEQDYLNENDYKAIDPLIVRHEPISEFHGSSTPTGDRGKFWQMCTQMPNFREFYFPITVHPNWSEELEVLYRQQAKTEDVYNHEYLALFSDPASGVFKSPHIDAAKTIYENRNYPMLKGYDTERYNPAWRYFMGVDWNGGGTGTRIRVIGYNSETKVRRCVAKKTVDHPGFTTEDSINAIIQLNKTWHCEEIYLDAGFGFVQDELIRKVGKLSNDADTQKLKDVHTIDFGAELKFNRLVSKRDDQLKKSRYLPDPKDEELKRRTKPFMVEGAVMAFEHQLVQFSTLDVILEEQLRAYRVKTYSAHGYANTYEADGGVGDHDLDAFMLALMAVEQKYGLFADPNQYRRMAQFSFVPGWGVPAVDQDSGKQDAPTSDEKRLERAGIPSRQINADKNNQYRLVRILNGRVGQPGGIIAPANRGPQINRTRAASRTDIFKKKPPTGYF